MFNVPLLMVDALVKVSEPPVIANVSSPRNWIALGVCARVAIVMVGAPERSGTCPVSAEFGSWPRLQLPLDAHRKSAAPPVQVLIMLPRKNEVPP